MSQPNNTIKAVVIMIVFGLGSKLLGFIREMLIAAKFGSGLETDTFFIAVTATGLFTTMIAQSLNTTIIPIMADIEKNEGKKGKISHINNLLNIVVSISIIFVLIGWLAAPLIIEIIAPGFIGEQFNLAVILMQIGMPVIIFAGLVGVYRGYLQSESRFTESSASQFPFNFTYIFFLLFFSSILGIKGLMITSVIAVASQLLIQIPGIIRTGYRYEFIFNLKDVYIKKIVYLVFPALISVTINDINKIVDRSLASTLAEGSISALNYSGRLNSLILAVFITAIATVLFPMLSKEAAKETYDNFKKLIKNGVNTILIITIPTMVGMIILAEPIVKLTFERGAFNTIATQMTSQALIFYSLGLIGMALRIFIDKAYFSLQDTKTPMINGFITVGLNIILNFLLVRPMAHGGLALATSIATTITTGYLFWGLYRKIGHFYLSSIIKCGLKSLISATIMGVSVCLTYYSLQGYFSASSVLRLVNLSLSITLGAVIYFIVLYLLRVDEISWIVSLLKNKFKRN